MGRPLQPRPNCAWCGDPCLPRSKAYAERRYCSRACSSAGRSAARLLMDDNPCAECGILMNPLRKYATCSHRCGGRAANARWEGHDSTSVKAAYMRRWTLDTRYGITPDQYEEMREAQDGRCALCRRVWDKPLHVDHCNESQVIRGLLCSPCNTGIGALRHDPLTLRRAARYVESPPNLIPIRKAA